MSFQGKGARGTRQSRSDGAPRAVVQVCLLSRPSTTPAGPGPTRAVGTANAAAPAELAVVRGKHNASTLVIGGFRENRSRQYSYGSTSRNCQPKNSAPIGTPRCDPAFTPNSERKGQSWSHGLGNWRNPWSCAFCPAAPSPPLLARRCSPPRARLRPPSPCLRRRRSVPWPPRASSLSNGMADGVMGGMAAGITDGAGVGIADGDGMAAAGAPVGVRAGATALSGVAGGAHGGSASAGGSESHVSRAESLS